MVLGIMGIAILPARWYVRVMAVALYIPLMGAWIFVEGAELACGFYHSCM